MNSKKRSVVAVWSIALGLWLLGCQCAQCFYSPSAGRWLSRDPLGEREGANLHVFVSNQACNGVDRDGRSFVLRENFQTLVSRPREGDYTNNVGLTWFQTFGPVPGKNKVGSCCWKIFLSGEAELMSWHVAGDSFAELHEARHIGIHRRAFHRYTENAAPYLGKCYSEAKASCFSGVLENEMVLFHLSLAYAENLQFDCDQGQDTCAAAAAAWREVPDFAARLSAALGCCRSVN